MPTDDLLQEGIAAVRAGDLARASSLLARVVKADPRSEQGWLWLGRSRTSPEERAFSFHQVLAVNPGNAEARQELGGSSEVEPPPTPRATFAPGALGKPSRPPQPSPLPEEAPVPPSFMSPTQSDAAPAWPAPGFGAGGPWTGQDTSASAAAPPGIGEPEAEPEAPPGPSAPVEANPQPAPIKTALNPVWLVAGLAAVAFVCLAVVGLVWYVNTQAGAVPDVTAIPTLRPTRAPATVTPTLQPTATSPFPTEWTKAPAEAAISLTPRPGPTTSAQKLATAQALVTQASQKIKAGDYEHAISLLDQAIVVAPRYGNAYYQRASAGNLLTRNAAFAASEQIALYRYLANINQALALDPPSGNYYLVRFHLEESLAMVSPYRVDQDFWHTQALADIRQANQLGNTEANSEQQPPFVLANLGGCQEAQDEVNHLLKTKPQPAGGLYSALAASDLCLKDAQSALKHIEAAINSQATSDRLISRVTILYSLGRWTDARAQFDSLLKAHPEVCPCRYAWRALLDYKLGDLQAAQGDLLAAGRPTPPTGGVDAYIRGLLALQAGDKASAVQFFQQAEAKLTRGDGPILLEEIQQQLADAGGAPLAPAVSAPPTPAPNP